MDDQSNLPAGAVLYGDLESWNWNTTLTTPFFGAQAHQSAVVAGLHQHFF